MNAFENLESVVNEFPELKELVQGLYAELNMMKSRVRALEHKEHSPRLDKNGYCSMKDFRAYAGFKNNQTAKKAIRTAGLQDVIRRDSYKSTSVHFDSVKHIRPYRRKAIREEQPVMRAVR